jgi:hypothetical protein
VTGKDMKPRIMTDQSKRTMLTTFERLRLTQSSESHSYTSYEIPRQLIAKHRRVPYWSPEWTSSRFQVDEHTSKITKDLSKDPPALLGLEWEVEFVHLNRELINLLYTYGGSDKTIMVKGDGSLTDNGREMVFKPSTLPELKNILGRLNSSIDFTGIVDASRTYSRAGTHTHIHIATLNDMKWHKVIGAINLKDNLKFWKLYTRRYLRSAAPQSVLRFCQFKPITKNQYKEALVNTFYGEDSKLVVSTHRNAIDYSSSKGTFELRLFGGATNVSQVLDYIEMADALTTWARNTSIFDVVYTSIIDYIAKNKHMYPYANARCEEVKRLLLDPTLIETYPVLADQYYE